MLFNLYMIEVQPQSDVELLGIGVSCKTGFESNGTLGLIEFR